VTDASPDGVQARLRDALRDAVKARDKVAMAALRSTLGLLDNADAADLADAAGAHRGRRARARRRLTARSFRARRPVFDPTTAV
jgi:hypothetical protein